MNARSTGGFALPLVLVAVAVASLSILALAQSGQGRERRGRVEAERFNARLSAEIAEARMAHLLVTEQLTARSLDVAVDARRSYRRSSARPVDASSVILDGRPYALAVGEGASALVVLRIQDEAGLLNINDADTRPLVRHLLAAGLAQSEALQLAAALADFVDEDDLRRVGGMDGPDHARPDAGASRNRPLEDVRQALGAAGWGRALPGPRAELILLETAALAPGAPFNPNTATLGTLRSVFGIDASAAARILVARERQLLSTLDDVVALTGAVDINSNIQARPAPSMTLMTTVPRGSSQESYVYVSRISIKQGFADRPIEMTRLMMPVRAYSRERARIDEHDRLVSLPKSARLLAP